MATNSLDTILAFQLCPPSPDSETHHITHPPEIHSLIHKYSHLFAEPSSLPPKRLTDHRIPVIPGSNPVNVRPYRYPHFKKQEIETQIQTMLNQGIIRPSTSDFSSSVLLVRKKDGTWRFYVDYRALNSITVKDRFPIPAIDELLDELYGTRWFSKLELRFGYHQIQTKESDIHKTDFRTHQGHYEFLVMSFGLSNAPSTFQTTMNQLFQPYLRQLVYSRTLPDHLHHLELVFRSLLQQQFLLKMTKCSFAQTSISYLGHIVSPEGVSPDQEKIRAMVDWPTPSNVKQLRGFLGLTGFYRKFVQHYASIVAPLTELLCKDAFNWTLKAQLAFDKLKQAMTETPVLGLPNFEEPFVVEFCVKDKAWVQFCVKGVTQYATTAESSAQSS